MATSLEMTKVSIERYFTSQGITPQQLINKDRALGMDYLSHKNKVLLGVWSYLDGGLKAEEQYKSAIENGASEIIIPLTIGERGYFDILCCNESGGHIPMYISDRIELSIYEYNVYKCPRCNKVYALRNMAASGEEE